MCVTILDYIKGTDVYLFTEKLKPALLLGIHNKYVVQLSSEFASFKVDDTRIIFYHEESTKDLYDSTKKTAKDKGKAVGYTLGYPPNAVRNFGDDVGTGLTGKALVRVNYHGIEFISVKSDYKADIKYMVENYPIPEEHQTYIEIKAKSTPDSKYDKVHRFNFE